MDPAYEFDALELLGFDRNGPVYAVNACDPHWFERVHPLQRTPPPHTPPRQPPPRQPPTAKAHKPTWNKYF